MTAFNYYLTWLHFDSHGRLNAVLPEGHRVLHVLHNSGSNRHPPSLWVLVEAVVIAAPPAPAYHPATPPSGYAPPAGTYTPPPAEEYAPPAPPVEYREPAREAYREPPTDAQRYGELSPERISQPQQQVDDYTRMHNGTGDYVPGVATSPVNGR